MTARYPSGDALLTGRSVLWFGLTLLIAAGLQSVVFGRWGWRGAHADFPLTLALTAALLTDSRIGCLAGLAAGFMTAGIVGETAGTFLVSRTLAGYAAGVPTGRLYRGKIGVALVGVFVCSMIAEVIYAFSAPRLTLEHWLISIPGSAALNAVLSLPTFYLLRRFGWGGDRR